MTEKRAREELAVCWDLQCLSSTDRWSQTELLMQAPRWNGSGMADTLLSGYTVFPSFPLAKMRNHKVTPGRRPGPWDLWRAIGWLERDHNRHLDVLMGPPITLSAIVGHQGNQLVNLGNKEPVLGNCPRQPYLLLALSVLGFLPA